MPVEKLNVPNFQSILQRHREMKGEKYPEIVKSLREAVEGSAFQINGECEHEYSAAKGENYCKLEEWIKRRIRTLNFPANMFEIIHTQDDILVDPKSMQESIVIIYRNNPDEMRPLRGRPKKDNEESETSS